MFTGGADPVLPTPFCIGAAGAATLAASGLAATELWQIRTGRRQRVTVHLRQATAAREAGEPDLAMAWSPAWRSDAK
jgi:hypothetical protein